MRFQNSKLRLIASGVLAAAALSGAKSAFATVFASESFDTGFFASLPAGWSTQNNSVPVGTISWFQGSPTVFPSFNGTNDAYAGVNFNSGADTAEINNFLVTPIISAPAGSRVSFVTRGPSNAFPDRLELRASPTGSANVGTTSNDFGDFTDLLLSISPDLTPDYPTTWTRFQATLPSAFNGRLAFRYWVTDGGPLGLNSNYIGIDAFHVSDPSEPLPAANPPPPPPASIAAATGGSLTGNIGELGQIDWYKFDHAGGSFTVNTNGSTLSGDNDTELGLYDNSGNRIANDDDSGDGFLSLLTLPNLQTGTYYLAIGGWNMTFGASNWQVTTDSTDTGAYIINGLSLVPAFLKGDFNFDGEVLDSDIQLFVSALTGDFSSLIALFPGRTEADFTFIGDFNGDGEVLDSDITGFVAALLGGGGRVAAIPEPAALSLLAPIGLLLARRRR